MNQTNLFAALLLLAPPAYTNVVRQTNWVNTGDSARKGGTNYLEQWISKITTVKIRVTATPSIVWTTNRLEIETANEPFSRTNTVIQLNPQGPPPLPYAKE